MKIERWRRGEEWQEGERRGEERKADCEIAWQSQAGVMAVAEGISMEVEGAHFLEVTCTCRSPPGTVRSSPVLSEG